MSSFRFSSSIFAIFLVIGIYVPFLPIWLEGRGLTPEQVGMVFAVALWARIPVGLSLAAITEHTGKRKPVLVAISLAIFIGFFIFQFLHGYFALLIGWLIVGTLLTSAIPLIDSMVVLAGNSNNVDYGRIRLWGSVSFIGASVLGGIYLQGRDADAVVYLLIAGSAIVVAGSLLLPGTTTPPRRAKRLAVLELLRSRRFVIFILTTATLQASHAALYGFATISWLAAGIDAGVVGLLWAEGVVVEIALFTFGRRVMNRFQVWQVLLVAGLAGVVRWTVLGSAASVPWLVAVQGLHALTFAATHLAAVNYISREISADQSATAQGMYDGMAMGLVFGIAMVLAGWTYAVGTTDAFYVMAIFSAAGAFGALALRKAYPDSRCP
jgi:PPP family 3-phenylpropionic acid transporter